MKVPLLEIQSIRFLSNVPDIASVSDDSVVPYVLSCTIVRGSFLIHSGILGTVKNIFLLLQSPVKGYLFLYSQDI